MLHTAAKQNTALGGRHPGVPSSSDLGPRTRRMRAKRLIAKPRCVDIGHWKKKVLVLEYRCLLQYVCTFCVRGLPGAPSPQATHLFWDASSCSKINRPRMVTPGSPFGLARLLSARGAGFVLPFSFAGAAATSPSRGRGGPQHWLSANNEDLVASSLAQVGCQ